MLSNVHVVQEEWLVRVGRPREKTIAAFFSPPPVSSSTLRAKSRSACRSCRCAFRYSTIIVGEVMHVDDHFAHAKCAQAGQRDLQQRAPATSTSALGRSLVSGRSRVPSRRQNHRLHRPIFSSSTMPHHHSTPALPRRCFASCSARYTERCWPPVQPNETIRFLKPRR